MVAPEELIELADTPEITGGITGLSTVTEIPLVAVFSAASLAIAETVCGPLVAVVVSHDTEYEGPAPVTTLPRFPPPTWNCTPVTPTLSVALAETVIVPVTVAPFAGAVMETVGGVVSATMAGPVTVNSSMTSSETLYPEVK
jgi:hypothetical protein